MDKYTLMLDKTRTLDIVNRISWRIVVETSEGLELFKCTEGYQVGEQWFVHHAWRGTRWDENQWVVSHLISGRKLPFFWTRDEAFMAAWWLHSNTNPAFWNMISKLSRREKTHFETEIWLIINTLENMFPTCNREIDTMPLVVELPWREEPWQSPIAQ